jgi:transcriptional regulator with XRE-family HTH domain
MPLNEILGRVREVLDDTGKTPRALADAGVASQQTLSRLTTVDEAEPSAATLASICEVLGVNGHWLLTGQGEKRVISGGGDAVFAAGMLAGRVQALQAIEGLPPISTPSDAVRKGLEVIALRDQLEGGQASHPRKAGRGGRRKAGGR